MFLTRFFRPAVSPRPRKSTSRRLALESLESRDNPSGGALDTTFGSGGVAGLPYAANTPPANAVQPDGKILAVQTAPLPNKYGYYMPAVTRLNVNGSPDTTFGTNGTVTLPVGTSATGTYVAVAPDGKILVAAQVYANSNRRDGWYDSEYAVARLNANGTLDTTFGNSHGWWLSNPSGKDEVVRKLAVVPNAGGYSILAAGTAGLADGSTAFAVAKLTAGGQPDTAFGTAGLAVRKVGTGISPGDQNLDFAVTGPGELVMSGLVGKPGDALYERVLTAFTPAGQPDAAYGTGGYATISLPGTYNGKPGSVVLAAQGNSVIVAGNTLMSYTPNVGGHSAGFVVRFTAAGVQDMTFGNGGVVFGPLPSGTLYSSAFSAVAVGSDGSIALLGNAQRQNADGTRAAGLLLERLTADGTPDTGFGTDGTGTVIRYDLPSAPAGAYYTSLTLDASGNLVVGLSIATNPAKRLVLRFSGA